MALTVTPSIPAPGVELWTYDNIDTADTTPQAITPGGTLPVVGFIQVIGTFGSASVALQGSNDNTNWVALPDTAGTTIAITAAGGSEFSTGATYIRPLVTGGTGDDLDVFISFRG